MTADDMRRAIVRERGARVEERVTAIGELVRAVASSVSGSASLWHDVLRPVLFDESEDDAVRIAAAHAGAGLSGGLVVNNLCGSTSPDKPHIRAAIVETLHEIAQRPLLEQPDDSGLRSDLARLHDELTLIPFVNLTLAYGANPKVISALHRGLEDTSADIRASAVLQLARIGEMEPATLALSGEPDPDVRAMAANAIGWYWTGEPEPIDALRAGTTDEDPKVAQAARSALRHLRLSPLPTPTPAALRTPFPAEVDSRFPWSEFLHRWSLELCQDESFVLTQDDAVIHSGWTGSAPAAKDELNELEDRIGRPLPASYRSFLQTTNGYVGGGSVERIRPAREVSRFIDEEPEWVETWIGTTMVVDGLTIAEHVASRGHDVVTARWQLLSDAIQISDVSNGAVYLLCPTVTFEDEWEAWLLATWLPGAARFSSWWDLLNEEHRLWQAS